MLARPGKRLKPFVCQRNRAQGVEGDEGDSELMIVIMTAVPGSEDETKLRLTAVAGSPATTHN
ncbi:hypothetical protein [Streptomyces sp. NPDC056683]|uniref:hypothetical protein n=1 Tax=Streptomyces sp. NPDC056683 TaxID=3345910 RepID=UPI00369B6E12